jgi:WhiB family transcriptional regulator, redox-sensing transcriptional regulator
MQGATCRDEAYDPEMFFPRDGVGVIAAQKVCEKCVVVNECLEYALDNNIEHGIWGGKSERERRSLARVRRRLRLSNQDIISKYP